MKIIPFAAILLSALSAFPVFGNDEAGLQELFRRLDRAIAHSGEYAARREARIDSLKNELGREELPLRTCFDLTEQLAVPIRATPRCSTSGGALNWPNGSAITI